MALKCFDVTRPDARSDFLVVYQSDFLAQLTTRFVIPLLLDGQRGFQPITRLNPRFEIDGQFYLLWPQAAFSARCRDLGRAHTSLAHEHDRIRDAFDFLTTGF